MVSKISTSSEASLYTVINEISYLVALMTYKSVTRLQLQLRELVVCHSRVGSLTSRLLPRGCVGGCKGWELTHSPGNAASTNLGAHCLTDWVQPSVMKYDIISYQFGLHDLGFDTERISVDLYSALLTNITTELVAVQREHGTKLLWVKTTPVPTVPTYSPSCNCTKYFVRNGLL